MTGIAYVIKNSTSDDVFKCVETGHYYKIEDKKVKISEGPKGPWFAVEVVKAKLLFSSFEKISPHKEYLDLMMRKLKDLLDYLVEEFSYMVTYDTFTSSYNTKNTVLLPIINSINYCFKVGTDDETILENTIKGLLGYLDEGIAIITWKSGVGGYEASDSERVYLDSVLRDFNKLIY